MCPSLTKKKFTHLAFLLILVVGISYTGIYISRSMMVEKVASEVTYRNIEVSGYSREDITVLVKHLSPMDMITPANAQVDLESERIIPEIIGREVDQGATVDLIMNAEAGENIEPIFREITPSIRWDDYPTLPAHKGNPAKESVSFMINVAWGEEYLPEILKVLNEKQVNASFFITGKWLEKHPEKLEQIEKGGHEIANHGYSDAEVMPDLDWKATRESLSRTNLSIEKHLGIKPKYFTPHKGEYTETTQEAVFRESMRTVMWSLDTVDWQKPGVEKMEYKIREKVSEGDIILMHPTEDAAELLSRVIPYLKEEKELGIKTVDQHLSPFIYKPNKSVK